ncbi:endonuclease/exonuclease/phosphatase family protein [Agaribacterium haliotis]|uniref:endonuclease/exonuclease/phosphatase family protein n=1 Tax=Agaribacterium haliotis TaxID=2013869 RepID=UPI000BB55F3D|nr:endonuclease/exonuclease/phosphatase family protein [Agaribacterium haliotis]
MQTIYGVPPQTVQDDLNQLNRALDNQVARQRHDNLIIGTWNLRSFSSLSRKWTATGNDSPKRDLRALLAIGDIIKRFDVCAVQEVMGNLRALRDLLKYLGDDWAFLMTDITLGDAGNKERLAYIYNSKRVQPSGLACEIVIPPEIIADRSRINTQFVRTPYAVSFKAGKETFILLTAHIDYGHSAHDRIPELKAIARWMADWAKKTNRYHQNLLLLGDFNIDRHGSDLWQAFTSTGLYVPNALHNVKRSIFTGDHDSPMADKFYDQIAWFKSGSNRARLNMEFISAGGFDFLPHVYSDQNLNKTSISFRLSDHYPLWVEFKRG